MFTFKNQRTMKAHCWSKEEDKMLSEFVNSKMKAGEAAQKAKAVLKKRSYTAILFRIYGKRKELKKTNVPFVPTVGKSFRVEMMNDHIRLYF